MKPILRIDQVSSSLLATGWLVDTGKSGSDGRVGHDGKAGRDGKVLAGAVTALSKREASELGSKGQRAGLL